MNKLTPVLLATSLSFLFGACSDDPAATSDASSPATTADASSGGLPDAGTEAPADSGATAQDGSAPSDATPVDDDAQTDGSNADGSTDSAFEACTATLKPKCNYDERETACASMITTKIPLSDGGAAGGVEVVAAERGAYVEWNEGKDFANPKNILEDTCSIVALSFGEPQVVTDDVLDLRGQDLTLYTVFRPACMRDGEKYPVITWGNGTCGQSGGYGAMLAAIASHGYVIFAANSRYTDGGNKEMLKALDFAKAANEDPQSVYYQRLDLDKVGAMGHSQGSSATRNAASDPRIKALILWNGGNTAEKPYLAVSGDRDIGGVTPTSLADGVKASTQPAAWLYYHKVLETGGNFTGHLTLMMEPERVIDTTVAWWDYMLRGDAEAKKTFVGASCGLCNKSGDFEYGQNGKLP